jgi:hypothetical protein
MSEKKEEKSAKSNNDDSNEMDGAEAGDFGENISGFKLKKL